MFRVRFWVVFIVTIRESVWFKFWVEVSVCFRVSIGLGLGSGFGSRCGFGSEKMKENLIERIALSKCHPSFV